MDCFFIVIIIHVMALQIEILFHKSINVIKVSNNVNYIPRVFSHKDTNI